MTILPVKDVCRVKKGNTYGRLNIVADRSSGLNTSDRTSNPKLSNSFTLCRVIVTIISLDKTAVSSLILRLHVEWVKEMKQLSR